MVSSLFQIFIGFSGFIGLIMRFVGPLTVAPTIALIGLSLFSAANNFAGMSSTSFSFVPVLLLTYRSREIPFKAPLSLHRITF